MDVLENLRDLAKFPSENPNPVLRVSGEGIILYSNDPCRNFLGCWECEAGKALPEEWKKYIAESVASGNARTEELETDGRIFSFEIVPVKGEDYANLYGRDITERRKAEKALEVERNVLRDVFETTLAGYWDWRIQEGEEYLSPAFKKMFGYEDDELPNTPETWQKLIFPEDLERVRKVFDEHIKSRGEVPYHNEVRYRHKDGSTIWVICAGRVVEWGPEGEPVRMVGCHVDITDRKKTEEALEQKTNDLGERVKELGTLYALSGIVEQSGIDPDEILRRLVGILPGGWQYPGITCARIVFEGREYKGDKFKATEWGQSAGISIFGKTAGSIDIFYREEKPPEQEGPFLKEERDLIDAIARLLGRVLERKQAEAALRENEEKFRTLTGNLPGIVYRCIYDENWTMKYISGEVEKITGYKASDFIDNNVRSFVSIINPDDRKTVEDAVGEGVRNKAPYTIEYRIIGSNGEERWVHERGRVSVRDDCVITWLDGVILDITGRKKAEAKLAESEEKFRRFFENDPNYCYMVSPEGKIMDANKSALRILGYDKEEIVGKDLIETVYAPDSREKARALLEKWKATGRIENEELTIITKHRRKRTVLLNASAVRGPDQQLLHTISVQSDISERKRIEAFKDEFVSTVSHELRTPLAILSESIYLMEKHMPESVDPAHVKYLELIKKNTDTLGRLINDVLDYQKLSAGKMAFDMKENDAGEIIDEVRQAMAPLAEKKGIALVSDKGEGLPLVKCDRDRIVQVLLNLVNNGIKFTDKGEVRIKTRKAGDDVCILVEDTGRGIEDDDIDTIFASFTQLAKDEGKKTGGTGLGLAIAQKIIRNHGSRINVMSEYGKGSSFSFCLPVKK